MSNRITEERYVADVLGTAEMDTSAAAQLRLGVCGTVSGSVKCGVPDVDVEMVVMSRALQRLSKQCGHDRALAFDLGVLRASMERVAKAVKAHGGSRRPGSAADGPSSPTAAFSAGPTSPTRRTPIAVDAPASLGPASPSRERQSRHQSMIDDPELIAMRKQSAGGLWGTLLRVASSATAGDYTFNYVDSDDAMTARNTVLNDSRSFGLANLGHRFLTCKDPRVKLCTIPAPAADLTVTHNAEETLMMSSPTGLVDFVRSHGLTVTPTANSVWGKCKVDQIITKGVTPFMTDDGDAASFINIDFFNAVVLPTAYSFSSVHHIIPGYFPRSWRLLGSVDGATWTVLRTHDADMSFSAHSQTCAWEIPANPRGTGGGVDPSASIYRHIRVVMDGKNSFGTGELQLCGFEVYGSIMFVDADVKCVLRNTFAAPRITAVAPQPPPIDFLVASKKPPAGKKK
jgi:hypothetical protein